MEPQAGGTGSKSSNDSGSFGQIVKSLSGINVADLGRAGGDDDEEDEDENKKGRSDALQRWYTSALAQRPRLSALIAKLDKCSIVLYLVITVVPCLVVLGLLCVNKAPTPFAGTKLYAVIDSEPGHYLALNASALVCSSLLLFFLLVEFVTGSSSADRSAVARVLFVSAFFIPSALAVAFDGNAESQAVAYCATNYIQNSFIINGLLLIVSSPRDVSWNTAFTLTISVLYAISCLLLTIGDLYNHDPDDMILGYALGYDAFALIASFVHYTFTLLRAHGCRSNGFPLKKLTNLLNLLACVSWCFLSFATSAALQPVSGTRNATRECILSNCVVGMLSMSFLAVVPNMMQRTRLLAEASTKIALLQSTVILGEMVPKRILRSLLRGKPVEPELHEFVVVFFADVKGFTSFCDGRSPLEVLSLVRRLFGAMDEVAMRYRDSIYKVGLVSRTRFIAWSLVCLLVCFLFVCLRACLRGGAG